MQSPTDIERLVRQAFADVARPPKRQIAPHECLECDELRCALDGKSWDDLEDEVAARHAMDLPLLSADAKRYFLPIWLLRSIADPESMFADTLVFNLNSDHRWDPVEPYTGRQRAAIKATLHFLLKNIDEFSREDVATAIDRFDSRQ